MEQGQCSHSFHMVLNPSKLCLFEIFIQTRGWVEIFDSKADTVCLWHPYFSSVCLQGSLTCRSVEMRSVTFGITCCSVLESNSTRSKQDNKDRSALNHRCWQNYFVWSLAHVFRLCVFAALRGLFMTNFSAWDCSLVSLFILSVPFEDPGAEGASGPRSSPEPYQIFPGSAQVSPS